jgi:hypothetical protein
MRTILYSVLFSLITTSVFSQSSLIALQYSVGFGTGDIHEYTKPISFRGATFDYRKFIKEGGNLGIGMDLGWNVFYEEIPYNTYNYNGIFYSGKQFRDSNHFPILLSADYYFNPGMQFNPFFGLGAGTMYSLSTNKMNFYSFENKAWQFALSPELGFIIELDYGVGLLVCSKYYYGLETTKMNGQGYFTLNVGIALQP